MIEQPNPAKVLLDAHDVAAQLRVSRQTVWRKAKAYAEGKGPYFPGKWIGGRSYRCTQDDLDKFCATT